MMENIYDHFENAIKEYFGERMKTDEELCRKIWSSLANVDWYYIGERPLLLEVSYSFRAAGGMIANIIERGDYMDWYCSGPDGIINNEFRYAMRKAGYLADDVGMLCDEPGCIGKATCGWPDENGGPYRNTCYKHYKKMSTHKDSV